MNPHPESICMKEAKEIFEIVLELPAQERTDWLNKHFGDDRDLVEEVESLLAFHSIQDDPLEQGLRVDTLEMQRMAHPNGASAVPDIPGYRDFARIASGGQGIVYRARQISTGQSVAVKVLREQAFTAALKQRLQQETDVLASLQHPNIVTVVDQPQSSDGSLCLVTRFVQGLPLDKFAKRLLPDRQSILSSVMLRICRAVDAAHRRGVVHRDLKPSNILVDENHEPYLLDFGLAKSSTGDTAAVSGEATLPGTFVGSVAWASPEQIDGRVGPINAQTDIYQLAVVFYHLLSFGSFPYTVDDGYLTVFQRILSEPPAPLTSSMLTKQQLVSVNAVLVRALSKSPQQRYSSVTEFGEALTCSMLQSRNSEEPEDASSRKMRFLWRLMAVGAVFLAAIALGLVAFHENQNADQGSIDTLGEEAHSSPTLNSMLFDIDFAEVRAPHLPDGWTGDSVAVVDSGQLTVAPGTRQAAIVSTPTLTVEGDWILILDHELRSHGQLQISALDKQGSTLHVTLHRGRIESLRGRREKTQIIGRRKFSLRRDGDRIIALLAGAEAIHLDASSFGVLSHFQFAMGNDGSGGGEVGIHQASLSRVNTQSENHTSKNGSPQEE